MKSIRIFLGVAIGILLFREPALAQPQVYHWSKIASVPDGQAQAVATDGSGNVYLGTYAENTIYKVVGMSTNTPLRPIAGAITAGFLDGTNRFTRFNHPTAMATDKDGNIFVGDSGNSVLRMITPVGTNWFTSTIAGRPASPGTADGTNETTRVTSIGGIATDSTGNIFFTDATRVRMISKAGTNWVTKTITNSYLTLKGIACAPDGSLFIADWGRSRVLKMSRQGTAWLTTQISTNRFGSGSMNLVNPVGIAVDAIGNVFVCDAFASNIRKMTQVGTNWVTTLIGGVGSPVPLDPDTLSGMSVDTKGNLYVLAHGLEGFVFKGTPVPTLKSVVRQGQGAALSWTTAVGQTAQLQFTTDLRSGAWTDLDDPVTATTETVLKSDPNVGSSRFYRVKVIE